MQAQQIKLRAFDPATFKTGSKVLIVGPSGSGKSTLVKDIMGHKALSKGIVVSPTEDLRPFYETWLPDASVIDCAHSTVVSAIKELVKTQRDAVKVGTATEVFLIIDDPVDKRVFRDPAMESLFFYSRYLKIFTVVALRSIDDMSLNIRSNIDYVFALGDKNKQNRERLYKSFFGLLPSFVGFCQLLDATTQNHECLVIDGFEKSYELEDVLFHYKARPIQV